MYSKGYKLNALKKFYLNTTIKKAKFACPFGKDIRQKEKVINHVPCSELCGLWPELGDIQQGCPCLIHGSMGALIQLEKVLIKEGYLSSIGEDI